MPASGQHLLAALAAGAVVLWIGAPSGRRVWGPRQRDYPKEGWADPDAPRRIREIAYQVERETGMRGLGDYLAGISYIESRGNPMAGDSKGNAARGWFGIRPESAHVSDYGLSPNHLYDERVSVILAADYAQRLRKYAAEGQVMDWLAVRRGWGIPAHVKATAHPGYKDQLAHGLKKAGVPERFMYERAFPRGFSWPGVAYLLETVR